MNEVWSTPHRTAPVDAVVGLPGSKSLTARALVVAALADGPSRLVRPLRARDTDLMAAGLRALGVRIEAGMVWVNQPAGSSPELPFGGVKRSGYGRELSELGMFEFANRKLTRVLPAKKASKPQAG